MGAERRGSAPRASSSSHAARVHARVQRLPSGCIVVAMHASSAANRCGEGCTSARRARRASALLAAVIVTLAALVVPVAPVALVAAADGADAAPAAAATRSIAIQGPSQWPTSPLTRRSDPGLAWNGLQLLVWSGVHDRIPLIDGSAFHVPRADWETVPIGGPSGPVMASATSAGAYVVLINNSGAELNPATSTWHRLPRLSDHHAVFRAVT